MRHPISELYLIRHAESERNTQRHLCGGRSTESPLTEKGIEQARQLGRFLLQNGIIPSRVFTSPAVRTQATATHTLDEMGLVFNFIIHDDLHEMSQGDWEGKPREEVYNDNVLVEIQRLGKDFKLAGGESMNEVGVRMFNRINSLSDSISVADGKDCSFVFTHGLAIRCLMSHMHDWSHEQTFRTSTPNTSITHMVRDENGWTLDYFARVPELA